MSRKTNGIVDILSNVSQEDGSEEQVISSCATASGKVKNGETATLMPSDARGQKRGNSEEEEEMVEYNKDSQSNYFVGSQSDGKSFKNGNMNSKKRRLSHNHQGADIDNNYTEHYDYSKTNDIDQNYYINETNINSGGDDNAQESKPSADMSSATSLPQTHNHHSFMPLEITEHDEGSNSALSSAASSPNHPYNETLESAGSCESSTSSSPFPVPPAPPSTPVAEYEYSQSSASIGLQDDSDTSYHSKKRSFHDTSTPLPRQTPYQHQTYSHSHEGYTASASASASNYSSTTNQTSAQSSSTSNPDNTPGEEKTDEDLIEDFSEWKVGSRYELIRILGRGSYGEVAQARDKASQEGEKFVAIKKITAAFEQEVDSLRLFREIHILRKLRGHECIIQLLDIVPPESDSIDEFQDLYLVFECKFYIIFLMGVYYYSFQYVDE